MAQLSNLIQDEQLIGVQFDTNHIATVLNEILKLFQDQTQRLTKIEHQLPYLAEKESVEKLENEFNEFMNQTNQNLEQIQTDNKQRDDNVASELAKLKEFIAEETLASVSEARRLVTNEISNYVPSVYENDPIIAKINENIENNKKSINELRDNFDTISMPSMSSGNDGNGPAPIRLLQCEKKVKELETRLQSYPQIESDLSNLQLQFPTVVRRLERKINDIQSAVEDKTGIKITSSNQESVLSPTGDNNETSQNENAEIDIIPPLPKPPELPQLLPDLEPPPSVKAAQLKQQTTKDEPFEITADKSEPVVRVYETHTHVSELNSSVRVVSELEWCAKAINQHHDVLRQVQQNLRTQQDNFDTITENLMRVNTTHNNRLSQLAQQQLNQNQEIEEFKRHVSEHICALQQTLHKSIQDLQTEISSNQSELVPIKKVEDSPRSMDKSGATRKITLPVLSPLKLTPANSTRKEIPNEYAELSSEPESTGRDTKRSHLSTKQNGYDVKSDDSASFLDEPIREPKKNRINLSIAQFNTEILTPQVTKIKPTYLTAQEAYNNSHYDHPATTITPQRLQHYSPQKLKAEDENEDEEFPEKPDEITVVRNPIVVNGDVINFTRAAMRQGLTNGYSEFSLNGQEINELIEDKVSMIARKSVSILVDKARTEMKEQTKQVQKTVDQVISLIDIKIDREFVERMFNKFRVMVNEINDKIDTLQCSFLDWVTRDELEMVLQKFAGVVADVKDAAATKTKYNCLLCGRPREHLAGMLITSDSPKRQARSSSKTAVKASRKLSTAMPTTAPTNSVSNDSTSETGKRSKTALGGHPHDVVQLLTLT